MSDDGVVTLSADKLRLELSHSIGGAISAFEWIDGESALPILRKSHTRPEKALDAASFPLIPYVNRIRGGSFTFRGREIRLRPNMAGDPSPLHGQGWLHAWTIEDSSTRNAVLSFRHESGEWPWTYEARQDFSIDEGGFGVTLSCRNLGPGAMPCGLGQHPYFPCGPQTRIDTQVTHAWTIDERVLPVEKVPAEARYDLRNRLVCGQDLDNGFGGWSGEARMSDPDRPYGLRLSSPDTRFFQLYSPPTGGIFVAEPVTHANAALNAPENDWPELGMRILEESDEMRLIMRVDVVPK